MLLLLCWVVLLGLFLAFFFSNDPATTEIYTLSLHDALPISSAGSGWWRRSPARPPRSPAARRPARSARSEEHTSELQSHSDLVCRLLLEKKKDQHTPREEVLANQGFADTAL